MEPSPWCHRASRNLRSSSSTSVALPFVTGLPVLSVPPPWFQEKGGNRAPSPGFAEPKARYWEHGRKVEKSARVSLQPEGQGMGLSGGSGPAWGGGVPAGTLHGWPSSQSLPIGPVLASQPPFLQPGRLHTLEGGRFLWRVCLVGLTVLAWSPSNPVRPPPATQIFLEEVVLCPSPMSQTASSGHTRWSLNSAFELPLTDGWGWVPSFIEEPGLCRPGTQRDALVFEGVEGWFCQTPFPRDRCFIYKSGDEGGQDIQGCCVCLCAPVNKINRG